VSLGAQLPSAAAALERLVRGQPWTLSVLAAARACGAPGCWVGGGVLRDLVWDQLHGRFDPARVRDMGPSGVMGQWSPASVRFRWSARYAT
jgi:hypothetical protein